MFRRLLIANRGEIAIRVARAARELELHTIGVYSDADVGALHRRFVDESYRLGPAPTAESYLRMDRILEIARDSGAEAVHPGYGFLAENPAFVKACESAGFLFVGPAAEAMRRAGDKIQARRLMRDAGVPVAPGTDALRDAEHAADEAVKIEYPVILKAAAGGGGIGMHVVESEEEMPRAFESATSTAKAAFGDPTVFLEKYLARPRHIEIQFLADTRGHAVHLGERECSLQRRHQKLLEESPSPAIAEEARRDLGEATVRGMRAMGYTNAGTAEYLLEDGRFHFNEINARLQVEHPVTELVTGVDLVEQQLRIAGGEVLGFSQQEVVLRGHALECRLNAEDPANHFLPSPGTITEFHAPGGTGVRVDAGVTTGSRVPEEYDSLIAKVLAHAPSREACLRRMARAIEELRVEGVATNREFHLLVLQNEAFRRGDLSTRFLQEQKIEERLRAAAARERQVAAAVAAVIGTDPAAASRLRSRVHLGVPKASSWAMNGRRR